MKPLRFVALWAVAFGSVLVAQEHPEVAAVYEVDPGDDPQVLAWTQNVFAHQAGLRWVEQPGEYTLLMVHTTVDKLPDPLPTGITKALPFLVPPPEGGWDVDVPELAAYLSQGEQLMIPPQRVAAFVQQFLGSQDGLGFGTHNPGSQPLLRYAALSHFADPTDVTDKTDERQPWLKASWSATPHGFESFDTGRLGRESVLQMAMKHASQEGLVFDPAAVEKMLQAIDVHHGFDVYVQAIGVRPSSGPGERIQLYYKRPNRIRLPRLFPVEAPLSLGAPRHVPSPFNLAHNLYLAQLGDVMHIVFPSQVSFHGRPPVLQAYVPTSTGYVLLPQLENGSVELDGIPMAKGPTIAQFDVPANAISGWVWIEDSRFPGTVVVPQGAVLLAGGLGPAVWITAYQ